MRKQKFSWGFCFSIIRPVDISVWIPHQVQNDNHPKKAKSLWTPIRNLVYHPDEIPCQARDDIGKVMRFRIRHGMTTLLVVGEGHPPLKKPSHCGRRPAISCTILMRSRVKHRMTEGIVMRFRIRHRMTTTKKAKSLWAPTRNLVYHPNEIPCQARDDIGKVMKSRISRGMTTTKKAKSLRAPTRNLMYHPNEIPCQARDDIGKVMKSRIRRGMTTTKKAKSLWVPARNLMYHPNEIPCQARDDIGKVMRFRIRRRMTTTKKAKSLRALARNLVHHPDEILCQAQNDIGKVMRFCIKCRMTILLVVGEGHPPLKKPSHCGRRPAISCTILMRSRVKHRMTEGIVMRFRIRHRMTTTKKAKSLRAPTRNLVYHPDEIPCQAQND